MNWFEEWSMQQFNRGKEEERDKAIKSIANYLINQSEQEGKVLTQEEAIKRAEAMIS